MRVISLLFGLTAITLVGVGCVAQTGDTGADESVGVASQAQLDPGTKQYTIAQSGITVASAWAGPNGAGLPVEYWVSKASYSPTAARTFTGAGQTCANWKRSVCSGSAWTGATYYKATYVETPLDCAFPPGPCAPPAGAVSFLGSGSYRTAMATVGVPPVPFAWTYATGSCEYWANNHTISTGTSAQSPLSPAYTSLSQFESSVCAMSTPPTTFYTSYYEPVADFCSIPTC